MCCVFVSSGSVPARHVSFLQFTTPSPSLSQCFVVGESVSRASRARQAIVSPPLPSWHCALRFSVASVRVKNNTLKKCQCGCRNGGLPHTFSAFALLQICIRTPVACTVVLALLQTHLVVAHTEPRWRLTVIINVGISFCQNGTAPSWGFFARGGPVVIDNCS